MESGEFKSDYEYYDKNSTFLKEQVMPTGDDQATNSSMNKNGSTKNENNFSHFPFLFSGGGGGGIAHNMPAEPFSAITPSMWPQDILQHLSRENSRLKRLERLSASSSASTDSITNDTCAYQSYEDTSSGNYDGGFNQRSKEPVFDVFGFKLEEIKSSDDLPLKSPPANLSNLPFVESSVQLKRWHDYLAFHDSTYTCKVCNELSAINNRMLTPNNSSDTSGNGNVVDSGSFSQNPDGNFCQLPRSNQISELLTKDGGIPHALRAQVWPRLCGAHEKRLSSSHCYADVLKSADQDQLATSRQIEKDLLRTLPSNICFSHMSSTGVPRLRRILRCIAWLYPDIGYCQGMGVIVSNLLLLLEEEEVFWILCCIIEDLLPASYFSNTLLGLQIDQRVLRELLDANIPRLSELLQEHDIELSLVCFHWFMTLFASVVHIRVLLRIWDLFFYEGSIVLFRITLGILKRKEDELLSQENSADIFNCLANATSDLLDIESLIEISMSASECIDNGMIEASRRAHMVNLLAEEGTLLSPNVSSNQHISKRQLRPSKSLFSSILGSSGMVNDGEEGIGVSSSSASSSSLSSNNKKAHHDKKVFKAKNIRQTEILVDLRNSIIQVIKHFLMSDPSLQVDPLTSASNSVVSHHSNPGDDSGEDNRSLDTTINNDMRIRLQADYSLESHSRDMENYVQVARNKRRRAKALMDFERHDDDELGFRKNDIITVLSTKDEHCWIGELNGFRGWFPAKIVELLDERSKYYSPAGDDTVNENIAHLIRGSLCPALRAVFDHGLKRAHLLDSTCHPWLFIEEAATREVEKDFNSVYSRLVLCKTFRLDEDGKVLTPEEVLYKAVQAINLSHDAYHAQMDVKFRSLICYGLNEQVLHLWLETLCSSEEVVKKWYQPWSYMRSPGWVQIKCELRLLSQFGFSLSRDMELPKTKLKDSERHRIKESIQEMLVRQHLFSWELN